MRLDPTPWRAPALAASAALLLFLLLGSVGFFLNDEMEVAAAAHNLYEGRLQVDLIPAEYYIFSGVSPSPRVTIAGGHGYIAESHAAGVLGLPFYPLVTFAHALGSPFYAVAAAAAVALASTAVLARHRAWEGMPPSRRRIEAAVIAACAAGFLLLEIATAPARGSPAWTTVIAIQLGSATLSAAGVGALYFAVARLVGPRAAAWAVVILLSSTFSLWAVGIKYHAATITLMLLALAVRTSGASPLRVGLAFALAGLAAWFHVKPAAILLFALLCGELTAALRRDAAWRRPAFHVAAMVLGFAIGLAPYAIENNLVYDSPVYPGYVAQGYVQPTAPPEQETPREPLSPPPEPPPPERRQPPSFLEVAWEVARSRTVLAAPERLPDALWQAFVRPSFESSQLEYGLLMLSPLLALALAGMARTGLPRHAGDGFAWGIIVGTVGMYGLYALAPAVGGHESRYLLPVVPFLGYFAARELAARVPSRLGWATAAVSALAVIVAIVAIVDLAGYADRLFFLRDIGLAATALVIVWSVVAIGVARRWGPRWAEVAGAPVVALALAVSAWSLIHLGWLDPPRSILAGHPDAPITMMLSTGEWLRALVAR